MTFSDVRQRRVATNGISLKIAEQGEGSLVLLLHGFPESWYSWRHQFAALAQAGYHAAAPDLRGYGGSDQPHETSAYNQVEVVADIIGLIPALAAETAVVIGHDWGAPTAWSAAAQHPKRVPNLRTNELLPGIGHWTQQEAPEAVNRLLISFLRSLDS